MSRCRAYQIIVKAWWHRYDWPFSIEPYRPCCLPAQGQHLYYYYFWRPPPNVQHSWMFISWWYRTRREQPHRIGSMIESLPWTIPGQLCPRFAIWWCDYWLLSFYLQTRCPQWSRGWDWTALWWTCWSSWSCPPPRRPPLSLSSRNRSDPIASIYLLSMYIINLALVILFKDRVSPLNWCNSIIYNKKCK